MARRATSSKKIRFLRPLQCEPLERRALLSVTAFSAPGNPPVAPPPLPSPTTGVVGSQGAEPINGVGNNLANPTLGAAGSNFARMTAANFADGIDAPNGQNLPSARVISNLIANQDLNGVEQDENSSRSLSDWVYAWGQFIDHDIDLTEGSDVPLDIPIPAGDPTFDPTGQGNLSIPFDRSQTAPGTGTSGSNPAQFVNQDTSFIDGSMIYGSDAATAAALRTFVGGQLKTSAGGLLPYNTMGLNMADNTGVPEETLFAAGDVRANENVELTNVTTLFVREHNYQAALLARQHPNWTDQQLYNGARQIVIGEIQSITYNEWLPALMGAGALAPYRGYNPKVNPSIDVEFASAAFRLHTLLDDDVEFLDNNGNPLPNLPELPLAADFFQPGIVAQPGEVAGNLKYLASDNTQEVDEQTVDGLRNALFPDAPVINNVEVGASDLIADDIQRGRDQGDPLYNQMRVALGEKPVTSFAQITSNVQLQHELQRLYGNVNNVELFVGLMGEDHLRGSSLGNRSQPGEQRRDVLASEMSGDGLGDEVQGATVLLAAGFNGGKHRFHE
ncbi:MAG TPA: peroxidase family protein, partial [Pirellulales bacterium]|nr:peroxidase family protein [Pirellulales bacterium]